MLKVKKTQYIALVERLLDILEGRELFNGSITFDIDGVESTFRATLIIHRTETFNTYNSDSSITNIIPVWWEFHTSVNGEDIVNDFDFEILKSLLC